MQDKKLRIFISHRHEDITICEKIKGILAERAAGKIEFLFAPENIADGQEWYRWIRDNAPNADIFLFIYTKPSLRWDWALFETGMFEAVTKTNSHTFICLHSPKLDPLDLPEPVKILQTRPATAEKVVEWLRWLFGEQMRRFAEKHNFSFPYVIDDTQEVARAYDAVCTPYFLGFNAALELQYGGRLDVSRTTLVPDARRELYEAMCQIAETGEGPAEQLASMGCSIKWRTKPENPLPFRYLFRLQSKARKSIWRWIKR